MEFLAALRPADDSPRGSPRRGRLRCPGVGISARAGAGARPASAIGHNSAADALPAPHHRPRAKNVIFLFMEGGPSHIDMFDPKPRAERAGRQAAAAELQAGHHGDGRRPIRRSWPRSASGSSTAQSGLWVSDWLPHIATCADDLAVIRSCWANGINHSGGVCQMNTGSILAGRPSLGSWVSYGLGTENQNLPAFVVMQDNPRPRWPTARATGARASCRPSTRARGSQRAAEPIRQPADARGRRRRRGSAASSTSSTSSTADHAASAGRPDRARRPHRAATSWPSACRPRRRRPSTWRSETDETRALYGMDDKETEPTSAALCLLARRLVERGVRFVQLYHGAGSKWDAHTRHREEPRRTLPRDGQAGRRPAART